MNRVVHHGRPGAVQAADAKGHDDRNKAAHAVAMCVSVEEDLRVSVSRLRSFSRLVRVFPTDDKANERASDLRKACDALVEAKRDTKKALKAWRDLCGVK